MVVSTLWSCALPSLSAKPGRSHAQTRVVSAICGCTMRQSIASPPRPAVRITVGEPSPMQTKCSDRPSGSLTESVMLA